MRARPSAHARAPHARARVLGGPGKARGRPTPSDDDVRDSERLSTPRGRKGDRGRPPRIPRNYTLD
eukprot:9865297-Karenia_brevis.AAC.1